MFATNIDWDTGRNIETKNELPTTVKIPDYVRHDIESVAGYLSNEYGFCVFGFSVEI